MPQIEEYSYRPLISVYPVIYLDAIHYKVREDGKLKAKAIFNFIGLKKDGTKEILGLYLSMSEGAKFWMQVLTNLRTRGVDDVLIACVDDL